MNSDFFKVSDSLPSWGDAGRSVELRAKDGSILTGKLLIDAAFDGEEELPVSEVELPDGSTVSPFDFEGMRYTSARHWK